MADNSKDILKQGLEEILSIYSPTPATVSSIERPVLLALEITNCVKQAYELLLGKPCTIELADANSFYLNDFWIILQGDKLFDLIYKMVFNPEDDDFNSSEGDIVGYIVTDFEMLPLSYRYRKRDKTAVAFIRKRDLAYTISTVGHEIGHMIDFDLQENSTPLTEEARAYAFEYAWCRMIQGHDIGKLGEVIMETALIYPVKEECPLHNSAVEFADKQIKNGVDPLNLFWKLTTGDLKLGC